MLAEPIEVTMLVIDAPEGLGVRQCDRGLAGQRRARGCARHNGR